MAKTQRTLSALRQHVSSRLIIVNVLKIPIQIQFGLEKSLTIANALIIEPFPVLFCKISF